MRTNHGPIGPVYALFFVLMPRWLRLTLATVVLWNLLALAMVGVVGRGGLDWIGLSRVPQYLLVIAACYSMGEIIVIMGLGGDESVFKVPGLVHAISPWAAYVLPLVVMAFVLLVINPSFSRLLSPWIYRGPLLAAFALSLPIAGILFIQWIRPIPPAPSISPTQ